MTVLEYITGQGAAEVDLLDCVAEAMEFWRRLAGGV